MRFYGPAFCSVYPLNDCVLSRVLMILPSRCMLTQAAGNLSDLLWSQSVLPQKFTSWSMLCEEEACFAMRSAAHK